MAIEQALKKAQNEQKDLIVVNDSAQPPVCRIVEYSRFKFEKEKMEKQQRKKQREARVIVHELKLRPNIDVRDYEVKLRKAQEFLQEDNDKVKMLVPMRGREVFKSNGEQL